MINKIKINKIIQKVVCSSLVLAIGFTTFSNYIDLGINSVKAATTVNGIEAFPIEYQGYLRALQQKHPNWTFTALNTGLDWNTVINNQTTWGKSLVPISYDSWWKSSDTTQVESGWVNASRAGVEHVMNPLNYLTSESKIFQFETLSYNSALQNVNGVEGVLYGTSMSGKYRDKIEYCYMNNGVFKTDGVIYKTYAQAIFEAGRDNNVSPYHLAARIRQETGGDIINNLSINGKYSPEYNSNCVGDYRGIYNFYNIGANGSNPVANGLKFASTPAGPNEVNYGEPWNNPEKSIKGGAKFISNKFIGRGQNTLYLEKFNVSGNNNYQNQYMTNIMAPSNEATFVYKTYSQTEGGQGLNYSHNFTIPVYVNMPGATNPPEFQDDNTRIYLTATDLINDGKDHDSFLLRSEPNKSGSIIKTINVYYGDKNSKDSQVQITRIAKGSGDYDKVRVKNLREGYELEGYVYNGYVKELNYVKVSGVTIDKTSINLNANQTYKLNSVVNPSDAWFKDVRWSSNNTGIATVDSSGNVKAVGPGEAIITVMSNDQNKIATCKVIVTAKVESITLPKNTYTMVKGNTQTIIPTINPTNATNKEYTISSDNQNIVSVDGIKVKANAIGSAKITYTTKDGNKTATATIKVIDGIDANINFGDLRVDNDKNTISKINVGTKAKDVKAKINTKLKVQIKDNAGVIMGDNALLGTGNTIEFYSQDTNDLLFVYNVVIYGDIDGTGEIDVLDLLSLKQHLVGIQNITGVKLVAADIEKDGGIDVVDLLAMKQHLVGISNIVQ